MNILENIPKKNGKKKMIRFSLGKIEGQEIGISARKRQIKTTAKKSFLFFCSFLLIAIGIMSPMAISVSADVPIITQIKTMAELIFTLTAGAGTVITQPTIVNPIISEFGAADFQMQNLVDNGAFNLYDKTTGEVLSISTEDAISHIGDSEWLDNNNAEFKMDYQKFDTQVSAQNTLAKTGANLIHQAALQTGNPANWDWGQLIQTYLNQGQLSYELLFTDYYTGESIETPLINVMDNILAFWGPNIKNNMPLDFDMSGYNSELTYGAIGNNSGRFVYASDYGTWLGYNTENSDNYAVGLYILNTSGNTARYNGKHNGVPNDVNNGAQVSNNTYTRVNYNNNTKSADGQINFGSESELISYCQNVINGTESERGTYSDSLVNPTIGNLSYEDLENVSPSIEQGQAIRPFDQQEYKDLVDELNYNTENNQPENNPALVNPFIENYIVNNNPVNPDPDTPSNPIPDQPTIPDKDPITDEQMQENLTGTTSGLEEIFPFCIPFDIVKLIKGLRAERKAPVIDWTFESDLFGFSYTFHIDMSEFNDVAAILRTMELIVFIIGLAVATRKLIGAGG